MSKKRPRPGHAPWSRPYCKRSWLPAERVAYYSRPDPLSGCHIWHGHLNHSGYGTLHYQNRTFFAHRLAWQAKNGPIPGGMVLRHRCNVRSCVNPEHLVPGTTAQNNEDIKAAYLRLGRARAETIRSARRGNSKPRPIRIFYDGVELTGDVAIRVIDPRQS
jgi:hypothetical protein